jgi:putative chitinase
MTTISSRSTRRTRVQPAANTNTENQTPSQATSGAKANTGSPPAAANDNFEGQATTKQKKRAEQILSRAGHDVGKADGKLSAKSRRALKRFQRARGLEQSGELTQETFDHLEKLNHGIGHTGRRVMRPGMQAGAIRDMEKNLRRLGYDVGQVDGLFTRKTGQSVKAFKNDQKELKSDSILAGRNPRKSLRSEIQDISHAPHRRRIKSTKKHQRAERLTERATQRGGVGLGDKGPAVKHIQRQLRAAGFDPGRSGGVFDERTAGMVREFQRRSDLQMTGEVDPKTWRKLRRSQMESNGPTSPVQRKGEISGAVRRTERLLKKLGFNPGQVDGHYTSATQRAVNRFRRQEGLGGIGQGVGANALKRLKRAASKHTVSAGELVRIMPGLSVSRARALEPHLNRAMQGFGINTKKRQAAFLAQVGHESVGLRFFEEIASGAAYEGRRDLGNVQPGDGVRYKGRGPIQLTGRANYRRAGQALGLPLEGNPKLAAQKQVGFRTAGWFWKNHGLNELADQGAFDTISRRINGGDNGLFDRRAYWARARAVL